MIVNQQFAAGGFHHARQHLREGRFPGAVLADNRQRLPFTQGKTQRLDKPFFVPEAPFEKSGQYKDGTVFIEGLAYYKKKLYLYYGCADSRIAVAVCDNVKNLKVK